MRTVDRSERIRTYNFPQNRITDHRIGYTAYNLDLVLAGDLDACSTRWPRPTGRARLAGETELARPLSPSAPPGRPPVVRRQLLHLQHGPVGGGEHVGDPGRGVTWASRW